MNGKDIKAVLATVTRESMTNGSMSSLWEELPDHVAGVSWVGEIADCASTLSDWLEADRDYSLDDLNEMSHRLADSEVEDYYSNINKRVQELALWAVSDLDEEVAEATGGKSGLSLTDLNSIYLYCAMRGLFQFLAEWAIEEAETTEEAGE